MNTDKYMERSYVGTARRCRVAGKELMMAAADGDKTYACTECTVTDERVLFKVAVRANRHRKIGSS